MSNLVISLLFSIGSGAWIYNKLLRGTGNNKKNSAIAAAISLIVIFVIFYFVLATINKKG
jgi:predicted ABC-type exoprotein transport system permease subunit